VTLIALAISALIVFRHRGNVGRLLKGTERRLGEKAP
jgi:glycerol-3-phosphate acyltransferase PlsY